MYEKIKRIKEVFQKSSAQNELEAQGKGIFYTPEKELNKYTLYFKNVKIEKEYFTLNRGQYIKQANLTIGMHMMIVISDLVTMLTNFQFQNQQKNFAFMIVVILTDIFFIALINLKKRKINGLYFIFQILYITFVGYQLYDSDLQSKDRLTNDPFLRGFSVSNFIVLGIQGSNFLLKFTSFFYSISIFFVAVYLKSDVQITIIIRLFLIVLLYIYTVYTTDKFYRFSYLIQKQIEQYNQMMNNQAPYCLISARFNQKQDKIELIECNARAQQEFLIKGDTDFDNFISQIYIKKKNKPNFMISNQQIEEQCNYQNSLKGQMRVLIQQEIDKQRSETDEVKKFQKQMTLRSKKRYLKAQKKKGQLNNSQDEIKENNEINQVDSNNFVLNQDLERQQDANVKKLKLFHYDKESNQENKLTAKLSLFKWHQYYMIITIDKKKQSSQEQKNKHFLTTTQPSYIKEKTNSISVNFNVQNNLNDKYIRNSLLKQNQIAYQQQNQQYQLIQQQQIQQTNLQQQSYQFQQQTQLLNYYSNQYSNPQLNLQQNQLQHQQTQFPITQIGSLNNISTSNNIQNLSMTPNLYGQTNSQNTNNGSVNTNQLVQKIAQSEQTHNSTLQTSSYTQNAQVQNMLQYHLLIQDMQKKDWIIEILQESIKIGVQKLEEFKERYDASRFILLNIDPQSYFRSFISEIQLANANILKIMKIKNQKQQISLSRVRISELTQALKQHFDPIFRDNQISLFIDQANDDKITTDKYILQQIFVNLISYCYRLQKETISNIQRNRYVAVKYTRNYVNSQMKIQIQMPYVDNHKFDQIQIDDISLESFRLDKMNHKNLFLEIKTSQLLLNFINKQKLQCYQQDQAKQFPINCYNQLNQNCSTQDPSESPLKQYQQERKSSFNKSEYTFQQQNSINSLQTPISSPINNLAKHNNLLSPIASSQHSFNANPSSSFFGNSYISSQKKLNLEFKKSYESGQDSENNFNPVNLNKQNSDKTQNDVKFTNSSNLQIPEPSFQRFQSKKKSTYLKYKESKGEQNQAQPKLSIDFDENGIEKINKAIQQKSSKNTLVINGERRLNNIQNTQDEQEDKNYLTQNLSKANTKSIKNSSTPQSDQQQSNLKLSSIKGNQQYSKDTENEYVKVPFQFSEQQISNNSAQFNLNSNDQPPQRNLNGKSQSEKNIPQIIEKEKQMNANNQNQAQENQQDLELIKVKVKSNHIFISFSIADHSKGQQIIKTMHKQSHTEEISENIKQQDSLNFSKTRDMQNNGNDELSSNFSVDNLFNQLNDSNDSIKRWVDQQQLLSKNNHHFEEI